MNLAAHGKLSLTFEDNLMIVEGWGPWNEQALEVPANKTAELTQLKAKKSWGVLAILHGDPIHTPEASQILTSIVKDDRAKGRIASAIVFKECSTPVFGEQHISEIYSKAGEKFKFFESISEGKQWLRERLALPIPAEHCN